MNRRDALKAVFGAGAIAATGGLVALAATKPKYIVGLDYGRPGGDETAIVIREVGGHQMWRWDSHVHERMQAQFASIQNAEWFAPPGAPPGPDFADIRHYVGWNRIDT